MNNTSKKFCNLDIQLDQGVDFAFQGVEFKMYNKITKLLQTNKNIGINNGYKKLYMNQSPLKQMLTWGYNTGIVRLEVSLKYEKFYNDAFLADVQRGGNLYIDDGRQCAD